MGGVERGTGVRQDRGLRVFSRLRQHFLGWDGILDLVIIAWHCISGYKNAFQLHTSKRLSSQR